MQGWQRHRADVDVGSVPKADHALPCAQWGSRPRSAGYRSLLGGGVWGHWISVTPRRSVAPHRPPPPPPSWDAAVYGRSDQDVAPPRGSAPGPLPGPMPLTAGRRANSVLLFLFIICWQHPQDTIERPPAEWAHSSHRGPPLDAAKAEAMEAQGDTGCIVHFSQADGARVVFRCLRLPCPLQLAPAGRHGRATLLQSFLSIRHHVLQRQTCNVPELTTR